MARNRRPSEDIKAFLLQYRVVTSKNCWEWTRAKSRNGYGACSFKGKRWTISRLAYELWVGPIPKGQCVCHHCDNPPCFNPDHLFPGTYSDNVRDCVKKGRFSINGKKREEHFNAKLTEGQVAEIRARYVPRKVTGPMLAKEFGVTKFNIYAILENKTWRMP